MIYDDFGSEWDDLRQRDWLDWREMRAEMRFDLGPHEWGMTPTEILNADNELEAEDE